MNYTNTPLIIPMLAAGYLLTVYLLLMLAQRNARVSNKELGATKPPKVNAPSAQG